MQVEHTDRRTGSRLGVVGLTRRALHSSELTTRFDPRSQCVTSEHAFQSLAEIQKVVVSTPISNHLHCDRKAFCYFTDWQGKRWETGETGGPVEPCSHPRRRPRTVSCG